MKDVELLRWYHVQVLHGTHGRRLIVEKRSGRDGITWDTLQRLKNEFLGPDVVCVEIYPEARNTVNEINRRHLWEIPNGLPFGLNRR